MYNTFINIYTKYNSNFYKLSELELNYPQINWTNVLIRQIIEPLNTLFNRRQLTIWIRNHIGNSSSNFRSWKLCKDTDNVNSRDSELPARPTTGSQNQRRDVSWDYISNVIAYPFPRTLYNFRFLFYSAAEGGPENWGLNSVLHWRRHYCG